ncbi:capsular biosynthesis protein [Bacillus sp. 7586-K]|uniref:glycosyltransferase family 1 protein n=1 Tax=Metabacillus niabensis TaxID=324854 RepID=UPI000BA77E87|nr:capsular biosynthesis protein [Bacillus sp. 7586-K]
MEKISEKRVLHVVGAMNRAGTETMLMNIYRNINRKNIQFDFLTFSNKDSDYDVEIKKLGGRIITLSNQYSILEIIKAIRTYGPYVAIHSHTLFHSGIVCVAAKIAGINVRISHAHTTNDKNDTFIRQLYMKIMRYLINAYSTKLLACSQAAGIFLFGEKKILGNQYLLFPNLIDYTNFLVNRKEDVIKFKEKEGLGDSLIIGHIGRFIDTKNHKFLMEIMGNIVEKNPKVKMILVGDGELRERYEEIAQKEGLQNKIKFLGIRQDIATVLHSMDIFVFPSKYEGLGLVLLEAQACGIPCVVSEAIQPESDLQMGLMTKLSLNDGPEIWADAILQRINKKELDIEMIKNSFIKQGYSMNSGITKLISLYENEMED